MSSGTWRLILGDGSAVLPLVDGPLEPSDGATNMAIDEALFEGVQEGDPPVLRLYRWRPACLSFGRHQLAKGIYDPVRAQQRGIDIVRRPTGGLAVLHDGELTYAVITPARPLDGPRAAYLRINQALVAALNALGAPAAIGAGAETHNPSPDALHPCFERPAPGEVVAAGRKLVGSAQRVERHTILQHGSILLEGTQGDVTGLQYSPQPGPRGEITLAELLAELPTWPALGLAVARAVEATFGIRLAPAELTPVERDRVAVQRERFRSEEWTWRR